MQHRAPKQHVFLPSWRAVEWGRSRGWPWPSRLPSPSHCLSCAWAALTPHWLSPDAKASLLPPPHHPALGSLVGGDHSDISIFLLAGCCPYISCCLFYNYCYCQLSASTQCTNALSNSDLCCLFRLCSACKETHDWILYVLTNIHLHSIYMYKLLFYSFRMYMFSCSQNKSNNNIAIMYFN